MAAQSSVTAVGRARHRLRTHMSEHPLLYLSFARHKYPGPSPEVIGADTELVIDGYTRSATTFAVYAFQLSQDKPVRLAHHLHAPAQLIRAAQTHVPALLLIREPQGAVLSQLVREPDVALRDALVAYCRFYACLLPYQDAFVVGEFEDVTGDFGSVIRRINARFGTEFAPFVDTEANRRECMDMMKLRGTLSETLLGFESGTVTREQLGRELPHLTRISEHLDTKEAWVPSGARDRSKDDLREQWSASDLAGLREKAQELYRRFSSGGGRHAT